MRNKKTFFKSPAKITISVICIVAVFSVLAIGTAISANIIKTSTETKNKVEATNNTEAVNNTEFAQNMDTAKSIAISDAGLTDAEVTFTKEKLDYEDGIAVYELEFYSSANRYEYEINAETGEIISKELKSNKPSAVQPDVNEEKTTQFTLEDAKEAAAEHAGFSANELTFSKADIEYDNGIKVYEIEFFREGIDYEYKINASTGTIIEYETDYD